MYINLPCVRVYVYRYIMKKASVDWFHQPLIHYYILPIFSIKSMDISKSEHRIVIAGKCDGFFSTRYLEWIKNKIKLLDVIWGPISVPFRSFDLSSIISFLFSLFLYRSLCTQFSLISGENVEPFILLWKWKFVETIWHNILGGIILWTFNYTSVVCGITSGKIIAKGRQITGELDWSLTPNKLDFCCSAIFMLYIFSVHYYLFIFGELVLSLHSWRIQFMKKEKNNIKRLVGQTWVELLSISFIDKMCSKRVHVEFVTKASAFLILVVLLIIHPRYSPQCAHWKNDKSMCYTLCVHNGRDTSRSKSNNYALCTHLENGTHE